LKEKFSVVGVAVFEAIEAIMLSINPPFASPLASRVLHQSVSRKKTKDEG
jgi:hypothetical protein